MGVFGIGERIEREDRLVEFAEERKLVIASTLLEEPQTRHWTTE